MSSTVGYTLHCDDTTVAITVVAYFKAQKAIVTLLREEHAIRIRVSAAHKQAGEELRAVAPDRLPQRAACRR